MPNPARGKALPFNQKRVQQQPNVLRRRVIHRVQLQASTEQPISQTDATKRTGNDTVDSADDQDVFVNIIDEEEIETRKPADANLIAQKTLKVNLQRNTTAFYPTQQSVITAKIPQSSESSVRKRGRPPSKVASIPQQEVVQHEFVPSVEYPLLEQSDENENQGKFVRTAYSMADENESFMYADEDPSEYGGRITEYRNDLNGPPTRATICCLCPDQPIFIDRNAYYAHRYESHGAVATVFACPDMECDLVFASASTVKRHLAVDHQLPIESHFRKFPSISEFNEWILALQISTDTRFVMYNRQKPNRRQLLYCACSDHRALSLNRRQGMLKPKGCCPVHANYLVHENGMVDVIYQMFHYGHHPATQQIIASVKPWILTDRIQKIIQNEFSGTSAESVNFPTKPLVLGTRPMQYIQVDIVEMPDAIYRMGSHYSHLLIVTCLYSKFMFARSLLEVEELHQEHIIYRLLTEIFSTFGVPEGYSCSFGKELVNNCMCQLEGLFRVEIRAIANEKPCYVALRQNIELRAEMELQDRMRWPEALPFTILSHNQSPHAAFQFRVSPFEMMFHRRAWYKTDPDTELPWTDSAELSAAFNTAQSPGTSASVASCNFVRQHDPYFPLPDAKGNSIEGTIKSNFLRTISHVETECHRYEDSNRDKAREKLGVRLTFSPGQQVFVRTPLAKEGYLSGLVTEADWDAPNFPYRVHIDLAENEGDKDVGSPLLPDKSIEDVKSIWVSAYDLGSTEVVESDGLLSTENLCCQCPSECGLFGNSFCANGMSKECCLKSGKECGFHEFYDPRIMPIDRYVETYAENPERVKRRVILGREELARQERLDEQFRMEQEKLVSATGQKHPKFEESASDYQPITVKHGALGPSVEDPVPGTSASIAISPREYAEANDDKEMFRQTRYLVLDDREVLPVVTLVSRDELSFSQQGGQESDAQNQGQPPPKKVARGILSRRGPARNARCPTNNV